MNAKIITLAVLGLAVIGALILWPALPADALGKPASKMDSWRVSCTADGGTPVDVLDEVDGGQHPSQFLGAFHVSNESTTCVNVGSRGAGDADPVDINTGIEIGDGCAQGKVWAPDIRPEDIGCTSQGAAVLIRVSAVRE